MVCVIMSPGSTRKDYLQAPRCLIKQRLWIPIRIRYRLASISYKVTDIKTHSSSRVIPRESCLLEILMWPAEKSLKIPKGKSEAADRRTDNTMAKRKRTNNDLQNTTHKNKDWTIRTPQKPNGNACSGRTSSSCPTCDTCRNVSYSDWDAKCNIISIFV